MRHEGLLAHLRSLLSGPFAARDGAGLFPQKKGGKVFLSHQGGSAMTPFPASLIAFLDHLDIFPPRPGEWKRPDKSGDIPF